ncbi:MAG TPA: hypothetical protein VGE74_06020 [Gemmata sp.]
MHATHSDLDLDLDLDLGLGAGSLSCSTEELALAVVGLIREMRAAGPFIRPDEREALRRIMAHEGALTVADVFPDFARYSDSHTTLRKLRTAQFIRPADRDRWGADEPIEIKPFARLLWDRIGEARIFGAPSGPVEEIDLALPGMDDPEPAPAPKAKRGRSGGEWDDADVLDFLSDDTKE